MSYRDIPLIVDVYFISAQIPLQYDLLSKSHKVYDSSVLVRGQAFVNRLRLYSRSSWCHAVYDCIVEVSRAVWPGL